VYAADGVALPGRALRSRALPAMPAASPGQHRPDGTGRRPGRAGGPVIAGLLVLVFTGGLGVLAALVPVGHGFVPKGGGWFTPAAAGGVFTSHPLLIAVPWAVCFIAGLLDWRRPWRAAHLDLLALAGFFPVAMLISDDASQAGLWLAAVCLGWLFARMLGAALGKWPMPELRPSLSPRWLGPAIAILLLVRIVSAARGNVLDVGQASSLGAWRVLHGLHLYGAVSWPGPGGLRVYRPDSYGPFAYYAYLPFVAVFPPAPALVATLLPAACFDALTVAGLHKLGRRLGGRPLARAFVFAYLLYPFPDLSLMAETNDALIAALCVWAIVAATERPVARGLLLAAAALTKFLPALLALQFLGVRRGRARYALTLAAALAAMLAWPLVTSGPARFLDSTFGYQLIQRGSGVQFSIWTGMPDVAAVARPVLAVALALLALSPVLRPGVQDAREQAAFAAALLIGAQLLLGYWFYSYLTWCYPLLVIAVIRAQPDRESGSGPVRVLVLPQAAGGVRPAQRGVEHPFAGVDLVAHAQDQRREFRRGARPDPGPAGGQPVAQRAAPAHRRPRGDLREAQAPQREEAPLRPVGISGVVHEA
jgi:Glycosyltransferase family 87